MAKSTTKTGKKDALIYVIAGEDEPLVNAQCRVLLDELIEPSQRAVGLFDANPKEVGICEVLDELRTLPFLSDKRVVLIRGADTFISNNREVLEGYFDNPCSTGILVLTVENWDERTRLAKKLPNVGKLIKVIQPKVWQLPGRLIQYAHEAHNKNLSKEAAGLLVELAGDELPQLYSEVDKLALYADKEKIIDVKHIEALIGHNRIYGAFSVIDACLQGDVPKGIGRLRNMFAEDRSTEYTVVGAFAYHFRRMFNAKILLEGGYSPFDIAKRLQVWGNREAFFTQVRKISLEQIGSALQKLAAIDYAIKTGQTKAEVAIEQLVLELSYPQEKDKPA